MNVARKSIESYREQIIACTQALALAKHDPVTNRLASGFTVEHLKLFTDGNLDKRFLKLKDQMELVGDGFDEAELEDMIVEYVRTIPLAAYDTGCSDSERFLKWITETHDLNAVQRDLISCQFRRYEVENLAREKRLAHLRFQELRSLAEQLVVGWGREEALRLELNPIHAWGTLFSRELLDEEDELPATVLFFPEEGEIRTTVVEPIAQSVVLLLHEYGPLTFSQLAEHLKAYDEAEISDIGTMLVETGLAAIG